VFCLVTVLLDVEEYPALDLAGGFPARKPGEPSVTKVTRTIEFHLLCPWQLT
jgi:hypothetical protein